MDLNEYGSVENRILANAAAQHFQLKSNIKIAVNKPKWNYDPNETSPPKPEPEEAEDHFQKIVVWKARKSQAPVLSL